MTAHSRRLVNESIWHVLAESYQRIYCIYRSAQIAQHHELFSTKALRRLARLCGVGFYAAIQKVSLVRSNDYPVIFS